MPQKINSTGTNTNGSIMQSVNFSYAANGIKLRKQTKIDHQVSATWDYSGRFVYADQNGDNTQLAYLMANQGRIIMHEDGSSLYEFSLKDHLGNTRITFDENLNILQEDAYYPYGMSIAGLNSGNSSPENKYKYNGKRCTERSRSELEGDFGLDWYDYGARFYDPAIARFHTLDPLATKYSFQSPFVYAANHPIHYIDWMGMGPGDPPAGTTQIYLKFTGSFGPQIGLSYGDVLDLGISGGKVVGETKVGLSITPEGKVKFLFNQESKNVNYEVNIEIPGGGKSTSSEYAIDEHPTFAKSKTEIQALVSKETVVESDEGITTTNSIGYEIGVGVKAILLGIKAVIGVEYIDNERTKTKTETIEIPKEKDDPIEEHYISGSLY